MKKAMPYPNCPGPGPHSGGRQAGNGPLFLPSSAMHVNPHAPQYLFACASCWEAGADGHGLHATPPGARLEPEDLATPAGFQRALDGASARHYSSSFLRSRITVRRAQGPRLRGTR